jgi:hypothetical protein
MVLIKILDVAAGNHVDLCVPFLVEAHEHLYLLVLPGRKGGEVFRDDFNHFLTHVSTFVEFFLHPAKVEIKSKVA